MTEREPKTIPDLHAVKPATAQPRANEHQADETDEAEPVTGEREAFNPFKFQSITMPPGLRAELLEHARNRAPEHAPEDTLPPNSGVTASSGTAEDNDITIRITHEDAATQRLPPRVVIAHERRRRLRVGALVLTSLALVTLAVAAVWTLERDNSQTFARPLHSTALGAHAPDLGTAAPALRLPAAPPTTEPGVASTASIPQALIPPPQPLGAPAQNREQSSGREREKSTPGEGARPSRHSDAVTAPLKAPPAASAASKAPSTSAEGTDLLDFQGPAPK
jgi:hypothetical protein